MRCPRHLAHGGANPPRFAEFKWLCALASAMLVTMTAGTHAAAIGEPAPVCRLNSLQGSQPIDTTSLKGSVVYVDFWASWCAPCRKAFPFMNAMTRDFGERGFAIVGINVDEHAADALEFLSRYPARFSLAWDASGECAKAFGVQGMPSSYVIDRGGVIRYLHVGFRPGAADDVRRAVEQALSEPVRAP